MALEKEMETFQARLQELKEHEGKFALIHGSEVAGIYSSYDDALKEGYEKFGLTPFLVKQIHAIEQVQFVSRFIDPCSRASA